MTIEWYSYRIDATNDEGIARLINDDHINPNMIVKVITVAGKPYPVFFSSRDINIGEEITYNYGDGYHHWRDPG